jgi:hypothetical protein
MKKTFRQTFVLVLTIMLLLVLAAPALANQPAFHFTEDVTGDIFECGDRQYTITSGELKIVVHEGESASGNMNFSFHGTPHKVVAVDSDGNEFRIVGAVSSSETFNANTGGEQFTITGTVQIVGKGAGTADSANMTIHVTAQPNNFVVKVFDFGSCTFPH